MEVRQKTDPAIDTSVIHEICSYCEEKTLRWCPDCCGCPTCCPPDHEHCPQCGQSLTQCEKTLCGGQAAA